LEEIGDARFFTGRMPFPSLNRQRQTTERILTIDVYRSYRLAVLEMLLKTGMCMM